MSKLPKEPDLYESIRLLNKLHAESIPNWTTQDQMDAYKLLQSLSFYWFRREIK